MNDLKMHPMTFKFPTILCADFDKLVIIFCFGISVKLSQCLDTGTMRVPSHH